MLDFLVPILTVIALLAVVAVLIKAGKVPKMPAFYERIIKQGIFNKLAFKDYNFRKTVHDGRMFPETKIEGLCSLCNGVQKEAE